MRRKADCGGLWNTGRGTSRFLTTLWLLLLFTSQALCRPDFLDSMSRQFFGLSDNQQQQSHHAPPQQADPFSQMFQNQPPPAPRPPPPPPRHHRPSPQRQGYYIPQQQVHHPHYPPVTAVKHHPHHRHPHPPEQPLYNGPPAVQGQQQGFGEVKPDGNDTKTEGFPRDAHQKPGYEVQKHHHAVEYQQPPYEVVQKHHHAVEYQQPPYEVVQKHHHAVEYQQPPYEVVQKHHHAVEYQHPEYQQHQPVEYHQPHQVVEYHHPPEVVEEHHAVEYQPDPHHHETPVEYHHQPPVEYHHKPKGFRFSLNQPRPDLKIIDKHLKLPPVKFRFHINPKIVITTNTKDPLDKKHHHDDEHDLEPYPPPDAFSQHEGPPQYNSHTIEHYDVGHHHYPAAHHHEVVEHHGYPVEHHHGAPHYPPHQEFAYDLSQGHSHPHKSYEPTFKVKTRPIIFTEAPLPPTMRTTTTTRRTTTRRPTTTTTTTTTARPRSRSRSRASQNARNPGFSVAFTQSPTTPIERQGDVTEASTTTRRSIFTTASERERENAARRDDQSSSSATTASTTTTTTTTTPTTTTTTTPRPTTTTTTTPRPTTTSTTTTTTTPKPTTTTTTTTTPRPTTTSTTRPTTSPPPEETTARSTTPLNVGSNEIDMQKVTTPPRTRPEPLTEVVERSESFDFKNSESVKVVETTMLIDGKNQTVRFYYVTQPVKLPLDVFQKMTGQKLGSSGVSVIKLRDKRFVAAQLDELAPVFA